VHGRQHSGEAAPAAALPRSAELPGAVPRLRGERLLGIRAQLSEPRRLDSPAAASLRASATKTIGRPMTNAAAKLRLALRAPTARLGFRVVRVGSGIYDQDGLRSVHAHAFLHDPTFARA